MAEIHHPPKKQEETSASSGFLLSAFNRLKRRLRDIAREISGNSDDADDALQEAFARLWERRKAIISEDEASALMTTTVRNKDEFLQPHAHEIKKNPQENVNQARFSFLLANVAKIPYICGKTGSNA